MYWGAAVTEWVMRLVVECNESEGFLLSSVTYGDDEGEKIVQNDLLLLSEDQVFNEQAIDSFLHLLLSLISFYMQECDLFMDGYAMLGSVMTM